MGMTSVEVWDVAGGKRREVELTDGQLHREVGRLSDLSRPL